jgi:hypothetical protein
MAGKDDRKLSLFVEDVSTVRLEICIRQPVQFSALEFKEKGA